VQELWESQGWDETVDLANNVAEVALQESSFPETGNEALSTVPFQDVAGGHVPLEPAFQETGAAESSEDDAVPEQLPAWTCSCALDPT
jgi:hypothetical protein